MARKTGSTGVSDQGTGSVSACRFLIRPLPLTGGPGERCFD
jgi:hypothetical protein